MKRIILSLFMMFSLFLAVGCQFGPTPGGGTGDKPTITYYNGDEVIETVNVTAGAEIELLEAPELAGFVFVEWQNEDGTKFETTIMPEGDLKVYAHYVEAYTYKFIDYDGTVLAEKSVAEGTAIITPKTPTREKVGSTVYTFAGWDQEVPSVMPAEDLTFTATYTSKEVVVVTYEINGGNWTYYGYSDVVNDLLSDYNDFAGTSYTIETLPTGAWECLNFHSFYYEGDNDEKWGWLADYLATRCSAVNYQAINNLTRCSSASELNALNENYRYSVSYEFRAFIIGGQITSNSNYETSDYSTYEMQNNFWEFYHEAIKDTLKVEQTPGRIITVKNAYKADHEFVGWYDNPEFTGNPIKTLKLTEDITLYAKFEVPNPVEEIKITNQISEISRYETHQLAWEVLPTDAGNKRLKFTSSNNDVLTINQSGLITAVSNGTAKITITSVLTASTKVEFEVEVYTPSRIEVEYQDSSYVKVGENVTLNASYIGRDGSIEGQFEYTSNNESVATVNALGVVTGVSAGTADITVKETSSDVTTVVSVTVTEEELSDVMKFILDSHESEVFIKNDLGIGSGTPTYYADIVGSVNKLLFNDDLVIDTSYQATGDASGRHYTMQSIEFVTVHYTGNMSTTADAEANVKYMTGSSSSVSIHYVTGNDGVFSGLSHNYGGWHAGDARSVDEVGHFAWIPTGVAYDGTDLLDVVFTASDDFYYEINGKKTTVKLPNTYNYKSRNTDHIYNADGTISSQPDSSVGKFSARTPESFFNSQDFGIKVVNGEYYMGKTWWSYGQVGEGRICSNGGNYNSIGIESAVDKGSDLWYTWQKTAQLVAMLLDQYDLGLERVKGHHFFDGKDCPQPMLENDLEIWWEFLDLVDAEYQLLTKYSDYNISIVSNNPEIVNNRGRIIAKPFYTTCVSYTVTVEKDGTTESITLYSIVEGTYNN